MNIRRPRTEVLWFADLMERELLDNDWKGGWQGMGVWEILTRLQEETTEVMNILAGAANGDIVSECADIANFAMFLADIVAHPEPAPNRRPT